MIKGISKTKALLFIVSLFALEVVASDHPKELFFQKIAEQTIGGTSKKLRDGTICDILSDKYAVEVDFAHKWYESVGQALHYAMIAKRRPGIVLIILRKVEMKFLGRLLKVNQYYKLKITIWIVKRTPEKSYICEKVYPIKQKGKRNERCDVFEMRNGSLFEKQVRHWKNM